MAKPIYLRVSFAVTPVELEMLLRAASQNIVCREPNAEGKYAYLTAITAAKQATTHAIRKLHRKPA